MPTLGGKFPYTVTVPAGPPYTIHTSKPSPTPTHYFRLKDGNLQQWWMMPAILVGSPQEQELRKGAEIGDRFGGWHDIPTAPEHN